MMSTVSGGGTKRQPRMHRGTATQLARKLHPEAFCKVAVDSPASDRCQVMVTLADDTYLVSSGRTWPEALQKFQAAVPVVIETEAQALADAARLNEAREVAT